MTATRTAPGPGTAAAPAAATGPARMLELDVVVRPVAPATLAMCPPLVIPDGELDELAAALRTALA